MHGIESQAAVFFRQTRQKQLLFSHSGNYISRKLLVPVKFTCPRSDFVVGKTAYLIYNLFLT